MAIAISGYRHSLPRAANKDTKVLRFVGQVQRESHGVVARVTACFVFGSEIDDGMPSFAKPRNEYFSAKPRWSEATFIVKFSIKSIIPLRFENPKIFRVYDAEVIGDGIAIGAPVSWDFIAQEA